MRIVVLVLSVLVALPSAAREIKLSTWNIAWLTTKPAGHPALPRGLHIRTPADYALLQRYAERLEADIVALQEVDGRLAAARVFDAAGYDFHFTDETDVQRPGFAIRRGLAWRANPDLMELDLAPNARFSLRRGADITVEIAGRSLRLLNVHLRAGCTWDAIAGSERVACVELARQAGHIARWIAARRVAGEAFAVLGDFNRRMEGDDDVFAILARAAPLTRATEGFSNPCWGGAVFIDHILLGGAAREWLVPRSLRVMVYRETDRSFRDRLSDHCPVSVTLDVR
ncbi:endonuclease/exonuclease/phosphatase family protein [Elioraea tepidiphila]|jgi:endonuclease/exonuclease/phosphatase family metal-dependent hydrolase|uniref:endonuclease/exonuclease/phosphatase family protein n=1 Tax=Elioraea tepidiphila TaxID=457934 RepID=UPI002FD9344E